MILRALSVGLTLALPIGAQAQVKPYIMIDVDTSGSMLCDVCQSGADFVDDSAECPGVDIACATCNTRGCGNGAPDDGRLTKVKIAVADVVNSFGEVTFGLARFAQTPNVFACDNACGTANPSGGWTGAFQLCAGADPGQAPNAADVLVPFIEDNQSELLLWVDGCDNWPNVDDCDPDDVDKLGGNNCEAGSLCPDCGTGCDKELRGSGFTPLAGSLASVREHIETVARPADPAAECRPYGVILLADGADNCGGEPELEAQQLCDVGVPTYSIGFGTCPLGCDDPCFDDCPGSTCPTRGLTPEGCFGANDLPHPCIGDGDAFPEEPGECSVGCQLFCQTKEIAEFGCGPNCDTTAQGQPRCDGRPIVVEDEVQLALAMAEIAQGSVLRELCNGVDDDCDCPRGDPTKGFGDTNGDGVVCGPGDEGVDEDFPGLGEACCDPCPGIVVCNRGEDGTTCSGVGPPAINCPEVCNGKDDDCDKLIDEGLICPVEVCDGVDNDRDGETDEPPLADVGHSCGTNEGACAKGVTCCLEGLIQCCGEIPPRPETCDCLDNNCNGETDENVFRGCYNGPSSECPEPESGECLGFCKPGWQQCETSSCPDPTWGECSGGVGPREERCNCIDDDCNGIVDDEATCPGGVPCINCACVRRCDPEAEFPCPAGFVCTGNCGGQAPHVCVPAPCNEVRCELGSVCDECSGECVSLCEGVECGELECCGGDCCETWERCENAGDGQVFCIDTSCTNSVFPCEDGQVCEGHRCVDDPCSSIECGPDQYCRRGECVSTCPTCRPDEVCQDGRCVADLCAFVSCPVANTTCCGGQCINDPCVAEVRCQPGEFCDSCSGVCREDLCPVTRCPSGSACRNNVCVAPRAGGSSSELTASGSGGCACEVATAPGAPGVAALALLGILATIGVARRRPRNRPAGPSATSRAGV